MNQKEYLAIVAFYLEERVNILCEIVFFRPKISKSSKIHALATRKTILTTNNEQIKICQHGY